MAWRPEKKKPVALQPEASSSWKKIANYVVRFALYTQGVPAEPISHSEAGSRLTENFKLLKMRGLRRSYFGIRSASNSCGNRNRDRGTRGRERKPTPASVYENLLPCNERKCRPRRNCRGRRAIG